ncbi:FAD-dependent oxidoreductase [Bacillus mangrovi]|uniref:FAD-dependent oxidoreductase n=1 Tax=Metabacillus mangrovi TaxID=1491830 RepID=A0A7X2V5M2_9BACI|nr:FAD-dependent oxidoreductase [Metabacillus mangrovi]MTH54329.1 FAD-dependent oxidoreductase [Metabacillus mangrovi]
MINQQTGSDLPLYSTSFWRPVESDFSFPPLEESIEVETVVVGGGITGITAAYLLQKAGIQTALIEARKVLTGTTGHTTAKITAQHSVIYDSLIQAAGEEKARKYYDANAEAARFIKNTISELNISCQLMAQDAYVYASDASGDKQIRKEWKAYEKLGIPGEFLDETDLPYSVKSAIRMPDQSQFHPVEYLSELLKEFVASGGHVYEQTRAAELEKSEKPVITTAQGYTVTCRNAIIATHYPFADFTGLQFSKLEPQRSYIIAARTAAPFPEGMYISADSPVRSLRSVYENGEQLVLIGGEDHRTGEGNRDAAGQDTEEIYKRLAEFGRGQIGVTDVLYRWSAQDLLTLDGIPYAGPITENHPNIHLAAGYGLWGMTNGTMSAMITSDAVLGRQNPYAELYSPQRSMNRVAAGQFLKQNMETAKEMIAGKLRKSKEDLEDLALDEGAKIKVNGEKAGVYKDAAGNVSLVKPVCTHMGCDLEWNNGERSWDCACHGSRFNADGQVLEGPAVKPLAKLDEPVYSGNSNKE